MLLNIQQRPATARSSTAVAILAVHAANAAKIRGDEASSTFPHYHGCVLQHTIVKASLIDLTGKLPRSFTWFLQVEENVSARVDLEDLAFSALDYEMTPGHKVRV